MKPLFVVILVSTSVVFGARAENLATTHTISSLLAQGFHIVGSNLGPMSARDVQVGYTLTSKGTKLLSGQILLARDKEAFICAYEVVTKTEPESPDASLSVCWGVK